MAGERFRHFAGKRLLRRAEAVIAVSDTTAADAIAHAGVRRDRVEVVPEGVGEEFQPREGAAARVASRWALEKPYLVYSGALDRRKDPIGLVRAWRAVQRAGEDVDLVLTGDPGPQAPGQMGGARQLGYVAADDLADLYSAAACFVYPSRYEGFGLPVAEAMACGCPVAAYDCPAVAEVAGDAALLVRAGDARALAGAITRVLQDGAERERLGRAGRERARRFTWAAAARGTAKVYKRLLASGRADRLR